MTICCFKDIYGDKCAMTEELFLGLLSGVIANSITEVIKRVIGGNKRKLLSKFQSMEEYSNFKIELFRLIERLSYMEFIFGCICKVRIDNIIENKFPFRNFSEIDQVKIPTLGVKNLEMMDFPSFVFGFVGDNHQSAFETIQALSNQINRSIFDMEHLSQFGFNLFSKNINDKLTVNKESMDFIGFPFHDNIYGLQIIRSVSLDLSFEVLENKDSDGAKKFSEPMNAILGAKVYTVFIILYFMKQAAQFTLFQMDEYKPKLTKT